MLCVITGAADGIGLALARHFGEAGYRILGVDVDAERSKKVEVDLKASGIEISFLVHDLSDSDQMAACANQLANEDFIDVMIHNAGISAIGRLQDIQLDNQLRVIDVNLTAPMVITAHLLNEGKIQSDSSLVFLSSLSHFVGYPGASVYAATKDGIASYARSLRVESGENGPHVLTVFPGPTRTVHARRYSPDNDREQSRMDPVELASRIYDAVVRRREILIPGLTNRVMATLGKWLPGITEKVMVKAVLNKLG